MADEEAAAAAPHQRAPVAKKSRVADTAAAAAAATDRGYAWVVLAAACIGQCLSIGLTFTSGVFFVEFLDAFQQGRGATAWVGSVHVALATAFGPLVTATIDKVGIRPTVIAGGVLACLGFGLSSLAPNVWVLYVTYALIAGVGISMGTISCIVSLSRYFDKRKSLAFSSASAAVGFANLVVPLATRELVDQYGWRGALIICGGLALNLVVVGSLLVPHPVSGIDAAEPRKATTACHCKAVTASFAGILVICKRISFLGLATNIYMFNIGVGISQVLTRDYAIAKGVDIDDSVLLLSAMGLASFAGRLITLSTAACAYKRVVASLAYGSLAGAAIVTFGLLPGSFLGLIVCCSFIGFFFGLQIGNYIYVINRIIGDVDFQRAYGLLMFIDGFGVATGPPIAAWLHAQSGSYALGFYCGGGAYVAAQLVLIPILLMKENPSAAFISPCKKRSNDAVDQTANRVKPESSTPNGARRAKHDSICVLGSGAIAVQPQSSKPVADVEER